MFSFINDPVNGNMIYMIITIVAIIIAIYNKVKYDCLKMAAFKVAEVEGMENLSGADKFALVVLWIEESLPMIFKNIMIKVLIEKLVQYAYDKSSTFAKNYVKNKTGYDITKILEDYTVAEMESSDE